MTVFFVFLLSIMEINFQERLPELNNWATILFVLAFLIIALNKSLFGNRFYEFSNLLVSDKYLKVYKDGSNTTNTFTISFFVIQLISFSFLLHLFICKFKTINKTNEILFIQIFTFLMVFILSKYLIEKIISVVFHIESFTEQFNSIKVSYRSYFGLLLLPVTAILYYNFFDYEWLYFTLALLLIFFNLIIYIILLKKHQNLITRKLFYFILYLCTLEIAPYYFIYYWVTKK